MKPITDILPGIIGQGFLMKRIFCNDIKGNINEYSNHTGSERI